MKPDVLVKGQALAKYYPGAGYAEIRLRAQALRPYLSSLLWALQPVAQPGLGTMAVDQYYRWYFDPALFKDWGRERCAAVLLHEVLHVFMRHAQRCAAIHADHSLFNQAADLEINCILVRDGLAPSPLGDDALYPSKFGFPDNLTAEEYYQLLRKKQEKDKPQPSEDDKAQPDEDGDDSDAGDGDDDGDDGSDASDDGDSQSDADGKPSDKPGKGAPSDKPAPTQGRCGSCGGHGGDWELPPDDEGTPAPSEVARSLLEEQCAKDIQKAAENARASGRGTVPGGLLDVANARLTPPKVDWRDVLRSELAAVLERATGWSHTTYQRPGRLTGVLANAGGAVFPSWYAPRLTVGIVVDTSGSMSPSMVQMALSETQGILDNVDAKVLFTSVDSRAAEVTEVFSLPERLQGGGGTDMRVGISAVLAHEPDLIVVMTDCDTPWPSEPTAVPLIVLAINAGHWSTTPDWATTLSITE